MDTLLEQLSNIVSPSGHEQNVRAFIQKQIKPFVDEIEVDKFGNLIAHKKGKGPKVMLAAHMDEIGLMIKYIKDNGHMHFLPVGGVESVTLVGQRVSVVKDGKEICQGIITFEDLEEDNEIDALPGMGDLYIDTGASKAELAKLGVGVGTYAIPLQPFTHLANKNYVAGKALDDRVGCYILLKLAERLKKLKNSDLYYVFTVQEEVGLYGAQTSVYKIDPDWAIACDVTNSYDAGEHPTCSLGCGPTLTVMDSEMIANDCINSWLKQLAKKHKIPLQPRVEEVGTTDATRIMLSKGGVPSTVLGVAIRNLHSTVGIAHLTDINHAIKLLELLLKNPPKVCLV